MDNVDVPALEDLPMEVLNKANRKLAKKIKDVTREVSKEGREVEDLRERLKVISEHMKNVKVEVGNTRQLVDAKNKEIDTEKHLRALSEREISRFTSEVSKLEKSYSDLADQINIIQNSIFRANERMDEFKVQMDFNQEELEQWALAEKQKQDDALALEKYHRQDDKKLKSLSMQLEKLTLSVNDAKRELETEITETQSVQIELDKAAVDFRSLHQERQLLVNQWEDAIATMQKRDFDIQSVGENFAGLKQQLAERQDVLGEKESFLQSEQNSNKELENQIANLERVVARARSEHTSIQTDLRLLEDELDVVRGTLARQSAALSHRRAQNSALTQDLQDSKNRLTQLESEYHAVEEQAREAAECENDMEKRMGSVESMLADAEAKLKRMERQLEDAKKEQYKKSTDLHAMRDRETFLHSEIAGIQAQNKNLQSKLQHYDAEAFKQQELLYNIEFQIQQMERKVSRLQGERTEEEKRALKDKIEDLNAELDEKQKALKVVQEQLKRVNDDVRRATRQLADKSQEEESLRSKISELTLENENAQIEIRGAMKDKETLLVQHDLLRLQVKKLRDQLNARRDELLGLQNRKEQLRLSILERVDEVTVFRESLRAELKCASEEKHKLILEMKERQMQVDRMKTKFGMIVERIKAMSRLGDEDSAPTIDEGEEGPTQAQFLIRVAQQREELQRQGDELDGKIAKLEKEERALKKTLNLLQAKNSDFSASIKKADLGGPDAEKKLQLEEKLRAVRSTVQAQRKEVAEIEDDNIRLEQQIGALEGEQQHIAQNIEKLHGDQDVLRREMSEQTEKMQQYEQKLTRLRESIRPSNNASEMIPEEMDIMTLEVRNKNKETVQRVMQLAQANPRVSGVLEQLMAELGISGGATRTSMSRVPVGQSNADRPDSARSHASNASDRSNRSSRSNGSVRATMAPKPVAPVLR